MAAVVVAAAVTAATMVAATAAISGECAFIVRFVARVTSVALTVPRFVALEVIEGLVSTAR